MNDYQLLINCKTETDARFIQNYLSEANIESVTKAMNQDSYLNIITNGTFESVDILVKESDYDEAIKILELNQINMVPESLEEQEEALEAFNHKKYMILAGIGIIFVIWFVFYVIGQFQ